MEHYFTSYVLETIKRNRKQQRGIPGFYYSSILLFSCLFFVVLFCFVFHLWHTGLVSLEVVRLGVGGGRGHIHKLGT